MVIECFFHEHRGESRIPSGEEGDANLKGGGGGANPVIFTKKSQDPTTFKKVWSGRECFICFSVDPPLHTLLAMGQPSVHNDVSVWNNIYYVSTLNKKNVYPFI